MNHKMDRTEIENVLHHLNYRWNLEALALWKGQKAPFEAYRIYEGFDDFIHLDTLAQIERITKGVVQRRLKHGVIDHYVQRALLPHETEMRTWMKGASALVDGQRIYFGEIIPWCQKKSNLEERRVLQKETSALCKFLRPFALNYWELLLEMLQEELGFESYPDYCRRKKGIDYRHYYDVFKDILGETEALYFPAMERWSLKRFGHPLDELTRFDAINMLGLGEFDGLFPRKTLEELTSFFRYWNIDLFDTPGLNMELGTEKGKSAQAICIILQAPDEVYVIMKPEGGWVDLETLWHEVGHGLAAAYTSSTLSVVDRDLATTFGLSESFAFLLQNLSMSTPFLKDHLKLSAEGVSDLAYYRALKELSVFRRYAAKFLSEYEMFSNGTLSDGTRYAELMLRHTGFYHQPESHLFDLVPEFYCLDYLLGWMGEAVLEETLRDRWGSSWMFSTAAGRMLKAWWSVGNRDDLPLFLEQNALGPLTMGPLVKRWERVLM